MRDALLRHAGAVIAVLGGGPSLAEQASELPPDAMCLSANQHGCRVRPCEYIVALDKIEDRLRPCGVPIIAPHAWADYRMTEHPQLPYTGMQGAWVAWMLGARVILLAGMDCYSDPRGTYANGEADPVAGRSRPLDRQLAGWSKVKDCVPVPIRALGGPLVSLFGAYDPAEGFAYMPSERHALLAQCAGITVEILQDHGIGRGRHCFLRGQILELPKDEAQHLLTQRIARRHIEAAE